MKYWEIVADKLSAAGLVVGLLQRRYREENLGRSNCSFTW